MLAAPTLLSQRGYSLAEMLVVVGIVAVMAVIVIPQFAVSQKNKGLKGASAELLSALRATRREAVTEREVRALALDLQSIPAQFVMMREKKASDPQGSLDWIQVGEAHAFSDNVAIVGVLDDLDDSTWDVRRTDDDDMDGTPNTMGLPIFNPADGGLVNGIYRLIRFNPTGTADQAIVFLWNIEDERGEIPNPSPGEVLAGLDKLGIPPGLRLDPSGVQSTYFTVWDDESPTDEFYFTVVVSPVTGNVSVYDYAWRGGWDRKKDGG
jgi:prepilin-type N-terminal cleavage/methylation domain-containing protein